jgi:hypothetical protein
VVQIKTEQALVSLETRMEAEELEAYLVFNILFTAVLRIRNCWIRTFLGLLDPDLDPLVKGMDPDHQEKIDVL